MLADLEQRGVRIAAVGVALGGRQQARHQARAHVRQIGGDRIGERQRGLAAAEQFGLRLRHEGPGDGLHQTARGERAAHAGHALLQQRQHRRRDAVGLALHRRGLHALETGDAHDLLDEIGLALDIRTPGRNMHIGAVGIAGRALDGEAELFEDRRHFLHGEFEPGQARDFAPREEQRRARRRRMAGDDHLRGLAAAQLYDERRRQIAAGNIEGRIDAALEAVARIGRNAEATAGVGDVVGIPERGFDQHVGRVFVAAGMLAAHYTSYRLHSVVIANHNHLRIDGIHTSIKREN